MIRRGRGLQRRGRDSARAGLDPGLGVTLNDQSTGNSPFLPSPGPGPGGFDFSYSDFKSASSSQVAGQGDRPAGGPGHRARGKLEVRVASN